MIVQLEANSKWSLILIRKPLNNRYFDTPKGLIYCEGIWENQPVEKKINYHVHNEK